MGEFRLEEMRSHESEPSVKEAGRKSPQDPVERKPCLRKISAGGLVGSV